ncbi:hypothetical protein IKJ53_07335 [bacterium]|nr:hypothetical protein [bacterium]
MTISQKQWDIVRDFVKSGRYEQVHNTVLPSTRERIKRILEQEAMEMQALEENSQTHNED